jgi:hypothetical protein
VFTQEKRVAIGATCLAVVLMAALAGSIAASAQGPGRPLPPPCTTPLPPGPIVAQLEGAAALDQLGWSVALGDVSGDGTADVIVGAVQAAGNQSTTGSGIGYVRVYNGASPRELILERTGEAADDRFGWRVAAGDVDGDGRADIVVSAPRADTSRRIADTGRIYIFSGLDGSLIRRIDGLAKTEQLGESLALADLNGDGKAELLAGAWSFDPGAGGTNKNNGIVRLYDGATGTVAFQRIGTERAEGIQDEMGRAVAFADVSGDGKLDLILGAGGGPGYVEVIDGADLATRLYLFRGDQSVGNEDQFGRALAAADLNGDGKAEIVAGAHVGDGAGLGDSGWVRIFDGATGAILRQLNGTTAGDHFGRSVAVGDVNGDLRLDVIAGAEWGRPTGFASSGWGYVRAFDGTSGANVLEFAGSCQHDHLGTSLAVGDVDGNGKANILAGAPDGDASGLLDNGYARLYLDTF